VRGKDAGWSGMPSSRARRLRQLCENRGFTQVCAVP
jgi:hypothetical protein